MKIKFFITCFFISVSINSIAQKILPYGLQLFKNIEQLEYCIPLPLKGFKEIYNQERASHLFLNRKNKNNSIQLRGFYSNDKNINIDTIFIQLNKEASEERGIVITQSELIKNKNCFYNIGYYNNFIGKYELLEITWIRKDEVVKMQAHYPVMEKKLWYQRLKIIIKNVSCN